MYVLVISASHPTEKYPLAGIFESDQAKALAAAGHKVVFAAVDLRSLRRWRKWGISHFRQNEVDVYQACIPVGAVSDGMLDFIGKKALGMLYKRIKKEAGSPDIVHAHFLVIAVIAADLCQREALPLVVTEHSSRMNAPSLPEKTLTRAKDAYAKADNVLAVSSALCKKLFLSTGIHAQCVHNIVDIDAFSCRHAHREEDGFVFAATGSLIHGKGFDVLLQAFSMLLKKHPTCKLNIYGGGGCEKALRHQALTCGLSEHVRFMGMLGRKAIAEGYHTADAFVLASRSETFGVVYIEAMAAGLPVIATRCGGPEDFVTPETGVLVPVDDQQALCEAMEHMVLHRNQYNREAISSYAYAHFSPRNIAAQLTQVYMRTLKETGV